MAPKTRSQSEEALKYILDEVFVLPADSGLRLALQRGGFKKIQSVLSITPAMMSLLVYKGKDDDGHPADLPLLLSEEGLLNALRGVRCTHGGASWSTTHP